MFVSDCLNINEKGHLTIGGCDTVELAKKYSTPLYVVDENQIRQNCRDYKNSIDENYNGNGLALYASKSFCCKEICRIVKDEKMGLDVVSGGELFTALSVDFPVDKIYFHGNNKTYEELLMAIENKVGCIVVDNLHELEVVNEISAEKNVVTNILFRIKPGVDAHTHSFIMTGQIDSKFGFALETGEAMQAVVKALEYKNIDLAGLHCHIGSQIFDIEPFVHTAQIMVKFIAEIKEKTGFEIEKLNLGGGFGIKYLSEDKPVAYSDYMKKVSVAVKSACEEYSVKLPFILIEPGRSIAGSAGITLYTIGAIKKIPDIRTYVSVDGGMTDNPRYILYQSKYEALIANRANLEKDFEATIAGKCCESGDLIQENAMIQAPEIGDTLAVLSTGAYNYSMASNYNRTPKAAVVMTKDGESRVIVKRETYEDMCRNDV